MLSLGIARTFGSSVDSQSEAYIKIIHDIREATAQSPLYAKYVKFISKDIKNYNKTKLYIMQ